MGGSEGTVGSEEQGDWLDQVHGALRRIFEDVWDLKDLANVFERVGNEKVAAELRGMSAELEECHDVIGKALGKHIKEDLARGMEETRLVVEAALAGIKVGDGSREQT